MGDMRQSIPRIKTVRFKDGRPPVTVLRAPERSITPFMDYARSIDRQFGDDMVGFVVLVWNAESEWECHYSTGHEKNPCPLNLLPQFAADTIRRRISIEDANRIVRGHPTFAWPADFDPDRSA